MRTLRLSFGLATVVALCAAGPLSAQPDVIVLNTGAISHDGTAGGISAYSLASTSCNIGNQVAIWIDNTNEHPLIAGNIYRIQDGLLEQIGMSWLKHGFCAVNEPGCGSCQATPCSTLGLQCADTYSTFLNGEQSNLGPRSDVNATTGFYNYPFPTQGQTGNVIFKRCQVKTTDIDPALNPGAQYFGVVQYVTTDEWAFGTQYNNNSYREISVGAPSGGGWILGYTGSTAQQADPIDAWVANASGVEKLEIMTEEDGTALLGRLVLGTRVTDLGGNQFRYQYAIFNDNSHRGLQAVTLPLPAGIPISNVTFNDCDYHSGEPYSNVDWASEVIPGSITWSGESFAQNPDANALRWGTTYTFTFETNAPPVDIDATLTFFGPGPEPTTTVTTKGPSGDFTLPINGLSCGVVGTTVELDWVNAEPYEAIEIIRDGIVIATLGGSVNFFVDTSPAVGLRTYGVNALSNGVPSGPVECEVDFPSPIAFDYPSGVPGMIDNGGDAFEVTISLVPGAVLDPTSPTLHYDVGSGIVEVSLVPTAGNGFLAEFPDLPCGVDVSFWVSAATLAGIEVNDPLEAPADTFLALSGTGSTIPFLDQMETDEGWIVGAPGDDATSGVWERVDPNGTAAAPASDHTADPGILCYVTGQGSVGGTVGENDVDGGRTTLLTPVLDMSAMNNPVVSYWRWYSNDQGAAPNTDIFLIEISANGLDWLEVETVGPEGPDTGGGWFFHEFRVTDVLALSDTIQLRFVASDENDGSIVEAAVDDFTVTDVECSSTGAFFSRTDCNDDGSYNITDVIHLLDGTFSGGSIDCFDACDPNDDGSLGIVDAIYYLEDLFQMGADPLPPVGCGTDPTDSDPLDCVSFGGCP